MMETQDLKKRTLTFSSSIIKLYESFSKTVPSQIIVKQLIRSATSVGANYRSAQKARSHSDFISKITIAEEEADERCYWIELLMLNNNHLHDKLNILYKEANELTAILTACGKTAKLMGK